MHTIETTNGEARQIKLLLFRKAYYYKPTSIFDHHNKISDLEKSRSYLSVKQFLHLVGEKGMTFCPSLFKDRRCNDNWLSQEIFAVDCDDSGSLQSVLDILSSKNVPPTAVYETFSSDFFTPKFRVIWILKHDIFDVRHRRVYLSQLIDYCKGDSSCIDENRLFFGGNRLLYVNYNHVLEI